MSTLTLLLMTFLLSFQPVNQDRDDAAIDRYLEKAYPPAAKGMERFVVRLPHKTRAEEGNFRVQIQVGKNIMTDGVNKYFLSANIKQEVAKGWGFQYYSVDKLGPVGSTKMGVPPGTPRVEKFVAGQPKMISYNSRLPVVVYVPKGAEVRYRIFQAKKQKKMKKG